jgi:hypothetical protein
MALNRAVAINQGRGLSAAIGSAKPQRLRALPPRQDQQSPRKRVTPRTHEIKGAEQFAYLLGRRLDMATTLANQLPRINLANGESMQCAQMVTLNLPQQNRFSVDPKSPLRELSGLQLWSSAYLYGYRQSSQKPGQTTQQ